MKKGVFILTILCLAINVQAQNGDFDNYRMQHQHLGWKVYTTSKYTIYYPQDGDSLVSNVLGFIQEATKEVEDSLFSNSSKRLKLFLYPSVHALQQSNIGISADKLLPIGSKRFTGNRIVLAYKGGEETLRMDFKKKLIEALMLQTIYGEGLQSFMKSVQEKSVPDWIMQGVPKFYSNGWSVQNDLQFKELVLQPKKKTFNDLIERDATLSGMAFLYYLSKEKNAGVARNFIYLILKGKSPQASAQLMFKKPLWEVQQECLLYYANRYILDNAQIRVKPSIEQGEPIKNGKQIRQLKVSNNSSRIAQCIEKEDCYKINVRQAGQEETLLQIQKEDVFQEEDLPIMEWKQEGLVVAYHKKEKLMLIIFRFRNSISNIRKSTYELKDIDGVDDIIFQDDKVFIYGYKGGVNHFYKQRGNSFRQLTDSIQIKELQKEQGLFIAKKKIANKIYTLIDKNGYMEIKENAKSILHTKNSINDFAIEKRQVIVYSLSEDTIKQSKYAKNVLSSRKTVFSQELEQEKLKVIRLKQRKEQEVQKDEGLNLFGASKDEIRKYKDSLKRAKQFNSKNAKKYQLKFISDYTSANLSNGLLINKYQSYAFNQGLFHQAPIGGMIQYAFTDVFEDHSVKLGLRLPSNGKGSDFFMSYTNRRRLMDWGFSYLRHVEKFTILNNRDWFFKGGLYYPPYIKQKTNYAEAFALYPFTRRQSVKMTGAIRYDQQIFIASDTFSLRYPDTSQLWSLGRINYLYDKTKEVLPDIRKGFRANAFIEYHLQLKNEQKAFMHVGVDARYYQSLYKNVIWANRVKAAASGGESLGIMYTLGGTQNQLAPLVDSNADFSPQENYSLISYATGLRGYAQNIRFGNSYVLINSEIRIPVLNTFFNVTTRLNSLNQLKLVLFTDVANAWNNDKIKFENLPTWANSFGFGLHTNLLNYQIRMDLAWQNLQQNKVKRPLLMFSLGQNF